MNIGNKIKNLRLSKKLTQQDLAGDLITRNMLSRIENGFALPSVPTLLYLSEKLSVPSGYLLAEDDEVFAYKKLIGMPDVLRAFKAGDWRICIDLCENLDGSDDEIAYLMTLCMYNEAKDMFVSGELKSAVEMFEKAKQNSACSIYPTDALRAEIDVYLLCISDISPLLVADIDVVQYPSPMAYPDTFCRYYIELKRVEDKKTGLADFEEVLRFLNINLEYRNHIKSKLKMKQGAYNEAYHILKSILSSEYNIPAPILYYIFSDLEVCCRELSDYRGAYEYSTDKTGMLEKFLG